MLVLDKSDLHTSVSFVPKTSVDGIPSGAIIGGRTADNFPLYIVQMALMGNLDARNNYAEYSIAGGSPGSSTDWDYMVIVYSEYCLSKCRQFLWFDHVNQRWACSLTRVSFIMPQPANQCQPACKSYFFPVTCSYQITFHIMYFSFALIEMGFLSE